MKAAELLENTTTILLDFDGPVTPLMPPPTNAQAADTARAALLEIGVNLDQSRRETTDHLALLRWTNTHAPTALPAVEHACDTAEMNAALACTPTPGANDFLASCGRTGRTVVIVSNNTASAIKIYLDRWNLAPFVHAVVGRPAGRPDLMKPHPHTIFAALKAAGSDPDAAILIGDSVSDIQVADVTGIRSIGYAKNPLRGAELATAGADALVESISDLAAAIDSQPGT